METLFFQSDRSRPWPGKSAALVPALCKWQETASHARLLFQGSYVMGVGGTSRTSQWLQVGGQSSSSLSAAARLRPCPTCRSGTRWWRAGDSRRWRTRSERNTTESITSCVSIPLRFDHRVVLLGLSKNKSAYWKHGHVEINSFIDKKKKDLAQGWDVCF